MCWLLPVAAQLPKPMAMVGEGWAGNSINTVVFRKNELASLNNVQYIAWYNKNGFVVLGKRTLPAGKWQLKTTPYKGNIADAHNTICIMVDGTGYLHLAWDHHNNELRYCKSVSPGSLEMTNKLPMTGLLETRVTYPEFHRLPNGNVLFLYRNGESGRGNLVINRYNIKTKKWNQLHNNLIDGQEKRSAYWQACTDQKGRLHISWVWRESADVASNHDVCYARSDDGGESWVKSTGEKYQIPINAGNAEYVSRIPPNSELINQTSMYADAQGHPFIASYWRTPGDTVPQYYVLYKIEDKWQVQSLGFRKTAFSLSGTGTRRIPISRPQIVTWKNNQFFCAALIFRDGERGSRVSVATTHNLKSSKWQLADLSTEPVGSWEPSYDTEYWKQKKVLHLFIQLTDQRDAEGSSDLPPQPVKVLEWKPE